MGKRAAKREVFLRPLTPMTQRIIAVSQEEIRHFNTPRIAHYWRSVYRGAARPTALRQPWSAAFISYVMQAADVPPEYFPPSGAHWIYLRHILQQAKHANAHFKPHALDEYSPQTGDLLCASRAEPLDARAVIAGAPLSIEDRPLHCDIVTRRQAHWITLVGGNVSGRVTERSVALSADGHILSATGDKWFLIIENQL